MQGGALRKLVLLALVAGVIAAVAKVLRGEPAPQFSTHPSVTGGPRPDPTPAPVATPPPVPEPVPTELGGPVGSAAAPKDDQSWVAPVDGACPDGYPVKAKLSSGIFHVPGGLSYERTNPDRCYTDAQAAEADGLRASKR